jgi:hypothetical protein
VNTTNTNERTFSIELTSRGSLRSIAFGDDSKGVLIEGNIGVLQDVNLLEELILEVSGARGTLRLDLGIGELEQVLKNSKGDE